MAKKETAKKPAEEAAAQAVESEETAVSEEKISELEKALQEATDKHLRTLAEYDNFRKRSAREKEQAYTDSKASVLTELLPVLDNFERAAGNKDASMEDYQKGVDMIFNQFTEIFKKLGAESYGEAGDTFDPNIHSAVMHTEEDGTPENSVTDVFSKGYKLGEKILRPAVVKVVN